MLKQNEYGKEMLYMYSNNKAIIIDIVPCALFPRFV